MVEETNKLKSRYAKKTINSKYYIKLNVNSKENAPKMLTKEEFEAGESGLVYYDNKTGKLVFDERRNKKY